MNTDHLPIKLPPLHTNEGPDHDIVVAEHLSTGQVVIAGYMSGWSENPHVWLAIEEPGAARDVARALLRWADDVDGVPAGRMSADDVVSRAAALLCELDALAFDIEPLTGGPTVVPQSVQRETVLAAAALRAWLVAVDGGERYYAEVLHRAQGRTP